MNLREYLKKNKLIMDGSMGTYYAKIDGNDDMMAEYANLEAPEKIEKIHNQYIEAGAMLIRTNTFAANTVSMNIDEEKQKEVIKCACRIAKKTAVGVFVAGDIGPIPENAASDEQEVLMEYQRMCDTFIEEGLDIIIFETFSDLKYIRKLAPYIRSKSNAFIIADFCLNKNGYTRAGISANRILTEISQMDEIEACGFNCGVGSGHMYQILKKLTLPANKYIVAVPNAGYPEQMQNRMMFLDNAYYFEENMQRIASLGVHMIGGCCGTTPDYIRALAKNINLNHVEPTATQSLKVSVEKQDIKPKYNEFYELFEQKKKVIAVELDPPYTPDYESLMEHAHVLKNIGVDIITFADSPMGRSRADSILMGVKVANEVEIPVMPHVCCRDKNMIAMRSTLIGAYINGVRNILIVTGDPVPSESRISTTAVFDYSSIQLMEYVNEMNVEHFAKEPLYYGAALNYARGNIDSVIKRMERKIEAGAKYFLTQPVYSEADIERLRYIKSRVDTKLLCGIMPLVSYRNANFIKNEIMGINVPDEIVNRYRPDMTKEEAEIVGANIANELIGKMDSFADGYYFMLPFNRVSLMNRIKINE